MIVSWMTTNKCNLTCKHCYQNAGDTRARELTTEEGHKLIDEIKKAGFKIMIFSGGEPMTRPDIVELVEHASRVGLRPVFGTNGTMITAEMAQNLKKAGAMAMGISIDSIDPGRHNKFRGLDNAFELTLAGIENCKAAGLPFQIHTTIMDWNQGEILEIMDWVKEIGAVNHQIFFLVPVGRGKEIADHALHVAEYEKLLRSIMEKSRTLGIPVKPTCAPQFLRIADQLDVKTRYTRGCLAGLDYCIINPVGEVRPCAYMTEVAGDVHETPFDEIWANAEVFKKLRTKAYEGFCGKCKYNDRCGGCRARAAYYHDGDYMHEDNNCAYGRGVK
ncbi:putative heme d1 biosynthesis radical SAM protein NirJ2 [Fibrobacter sp. UWEL]|uniref:putative heme d1 biosynthesis radical SAM protein NirJ2 n=1 Tax=Fibrobacter sp. UWEL TaxID=1896209 RepID=UPI00091EDF4F|nr:putative heme d1 biosynthesis radical SAM protein NirJ2 [Fibrobacter sp. UWEL]SHK32414.1 putative heme d1 biosynthesis radical SAM protein NirJ2 [Fibrobacter sp. UWEL]